jgi:hypothetical protein
MPPHVGVVEQVDGDDLDLGPAAVGGLDVELPDLLTR